MRLRQTLSAKNVGRCALRRVFLQCRFLTQSSSFPWVLLVAEKDNSGQCERTDVMRRRLYMVALIAASLLATGSRRALAEDPPKPDQLKQMYDDTLAQLKSAQERKTQLAAENEQLKAKLADLQKQLTAAQAQASDLEKQNASLVERNFFFRSHYAAWQEFL